MTIFERINHLLSVGIPITVIAKYCDMNRNTLKYYLDGTKIPKQRVLDAIEAGIRRFVDDVNKN